MKIFYICLVIATLILGYFLGLYFSSDYLKPEIINNQINLNDFYTRLIGVISSIITLCAVLVALFKEDLRKIWENVSLEVKTVNKLVENLDKDSSDNDVKVSSYLNKIIITNKGKLSAKNCILNLKELSFQGKDDPKEQNIPIDHLGNLLGTTDNDLIIHSLGSKEIKIIEILSPGSQIISSNSRFEPQLTPMLSFGNFRNPSTYLKGIWIAKFLLLSENAKPVEIEIYLNWNGEWHNRITEMDKIITIKSITRIKQI